MSNIIAFALGLLVGDFGAFAFGDHLGWRMPSHPRSTVRFRRGVFRMAMRLFFLSLIRPAPRIESDRRTLPRAGAQDRAPAHHDFGAMALINHCVRRWVAAYSC